MTRSNVASGKGRAATSATLKVTASVCAVAALCWARSIICGERSTASTVNWGQAAAIRSGRSPGPVPASRIRAPGGSAAASRSAVTRAYRRAGETARPAFVKLAVAGEAEHGGVRVVDGGHEVLLVQL